MVSMGFSRDCSLQARIRASSPVLVVRAGTSSPVAEASVGRAVVPELSRVGASSPMTIALRPVLPGEGCSSPTVAASKEQS